MPANTPLKFVRTIDVDFPLLSIVTWFILSYIHMLLATQSNIAFATYSYRAPFYVVHSICSCVRLRALVAFRRYTTTRRPEGRCGVVDVPPREAARVHGRWFL